jgi:hypothetical protein
VELKFQSRGKKALATVILFGYILFPLRFYRKDRRDKGGWQGRGHHEGRGASLGYRAPLRFFCTCWLWVENRPPVLFLLFTGKTPFSGE